MKSLKSKIIILLGVMLFSSNIFLGILNYKDSEELAIDIIQKSNQSELTNISDYYFDKLIFDMEYIVNTWAESSELTEYQRSMGQPKMVADIPDNFSGVYQKWLGLSSSNKDITWIYYALEADGSIFIAPVDPTMPDDYDARLREWYKGTLENKNEVYWTKPYIDAGASGKLLQTVSKPVYKDGRLLGVVGLDIELTKFTEIIRNLSYSKKSEIYLLNSNNEVLSSNSKSQDFFDKNIKHLIPSDTKGKLINIDKEKYVVSSVPIKINDWKLVAVTQTNLRDQLIRIRTRIITIVMITIILSVYLSIRMSRNILKPLKILIGATHEVSEGNYKIRTNIKSDDEFELLSKSFDDMLVHIQRLLKQRDDSYIKTVRVLANAIEASDEYTRGHCERVSSVSLEIAEAMELDHDQKTNLKFACILHDIGKIAVPDYILNKPEKLTDEEYELIKRHPVAGYAIIKSVDFLAEPAKILLSHHERVDGKGYPYGLKGEDITIEARILAAADAYDAMSSTRIYRKETMTFEEIKKELINAKGTQLDSDIVDILIDLLENSEDNYIG